VGGQQRSLAATYADPYLVVSKGAKSFTIQVGQRQVIVSVDRLKANTDLGPVSPAPIRLPHHMKRAGPWRCGTMNNVILLQLLEFSLRRPQLLTVKFSKFGSDGRPMCDNIMADRQ
jgi:hypothetical protein